MHYTTGTLIATMFRLTVVLMHYWWARKVVLSTKQAEERLLKWRQSPA